MASTNNRSVSERIAVPHRSLLRVVIVCALSLAVASAHAETMWDMVGRAIEDREFCAKNPDHDRCKGPTGADVLTWCESALPGNQGRCFGALDRYLTDAKRLPEWRCVPPDVKTNFEQVRRLFIREGERMPEVLHFPARQLLYYAVIKAFPCPLRAR